MAYHILVVDDEKLIVKGIKFSLEQDGMTVTPAYDGEEALSQIKNGQFDLVVLDVMLPKMDGLSVCQQAREFSNIPIIMVTAKGEDMDKIMGLEYGADDYITKPFTPMELLARVNSHLRRYHRFLDRLNSSQAENPKIHRLGGLEVNEETVEVMVDDKLVKVTPIEFKILLLLIQNPGRVFPAEEIYERVWNERAINTDTVMVHIRNLREKIEVNPREPKYVKVVWGVGYKIEKQP